MLLLQSSIPGPLLIIFIPPGQTQLPKASTTACVNDVKILHLRQRHLFNNLLPQPVDYFTDKLSISKLNLLSNSVSQNSTFSLKSAFFPLPAFHLLGQTRKKPRRLSDCLQPIDKSYRWSLALDSSALRVHHPFFCSANHFLFTLPKAPSLVPTKAMARIKKDH